MITSLSNKEQYGRIFSSRKVIEVILKIEGNDSIEDITTSNLKLYL